MKTGIIPAIAYGELRVGLALFAKLHLRSAAILAAFHASLADWEASAKPDTRLSAGKAPVVRP